MTNDWCQGNWRPHQRTVFTRDEIVALLTFGSISDREATALSNLVYEDEQVRIERIRFSESGIDLTVSQLMDLKHKASKILDVAKEQASQ